MTQRKVYIGSFTTDAGGQGAGITLATQDPESGRLTVADAGEEGVVARTSSPAFLASHPSLPVLYAVNERAEGSVVAYQRTQDGSLTELGGGATAGNGPCHLSVHPSGEFLLVANYGSGTLTVFRLDEDGALGARTDVVRHSGSGKDPKRQSEPHAHQIQVDPTGRWILATDLGIDAVLTYRLDAETGQLARGPVTRTAPGTGPRHLVFGSSPTDSSAAAPNESPETAGGTGTAGATGTPGSRSSVLVYLVGELSSTVHAFLLDPDTGAMRPVGSAPSLATDLSSPGPENYPSELALSEDGAFLYVANRGRDVIGTLAVSGAAMRPVTDVPTGGSWPRHLRVVGPNLYVANERSHQVTHFRLDPSSGVPEPTGMVLDVKSPACVHPVDS